MKSADLADLLGLPELPHYIKKVEQILSQTAEVDNPYLREPARRMINTSGKRLRPILTIAAASSQGSKITVKVINAGAAIELIHIGTIIHDDIIDDSDTRRGEPTINQLEGINHALLVGDFLLAKATALASTVSREAGQIAAETIAVMCDGQSLETADNFNLDRSIESYNDAIYKKTAALTSAACRLGALSAGLTQKQQDALASYGASFGMAFQLIDDLLDLTATTEAMGKPAMNDIAEGVYTFPLIVALKSATKEALVRLLSDETKHAEQSKVSAILTESGAFDATPSEIKKHIASAENALSAFPKNKTVEGLTKLPKTYFEWAMQKQTVIRPR